MTSRVIRIITIILLILGIPSSTQPAHAQDLYFQVDKEIVNLYWQEDGTLDVGYILDFTNTNKGAPIDFVDVGMPGPDFSLSNVTAQIDGHPAAEIESSPYVTNGIAIGLGKYTIQPGRSGRLTVFVSGIDNVLYPDSTDDTYTSAVFSPSWFDSSIVSGATDLTITYHLPPGVTPEEPRWHEAPKGFPATPVTFLDESGRVSYTWQNTNASASKQYKFGASFPAKYVPESAIGTTYKPKSTFFADLGALVSACSTFGLFAAIFFFLFIFPFIRSRRRKFQYLPPKIKIEGNGIKRGLTAVEAAVLLESPVDKILTMILFSVVKKGAAQVQSQSPLSLEIKEPAPDDLRLYETNFLIAFKEKDARKRQELLQKSVIDLIKSVSSKMKGFSYKESLEYYRTIMENAWKQVETAGTPEVKSEKYDENMDWTMLDKDFDRRTDDVFRGGPVFVPIWWSRYDPGYGRTASAPVTGKSLSQPSLPHLPGSDFAASVANSVQTFSGGVIKNLTSFTNKITSATNPIPKSTYSSSGGSGRSGCACACACAGCACACAGGGR